MSFLTPTVMDVGISGLLFTISCAFLLGLCFKIYAVIRNPTSKLPGPWYSKWTSAVLDGHCLNGTRCQYVHHLHQKHGSIVRIGPKEVDISDLDAVKKVYDARQTFPKSEFYRNLYTAYENEHVFNTSDPEFHRKHRKLLAGPLSEASVRRYQDRMSLLVDQAIQKIGEEMRVKGAADIFKWCSFMATDIIAELTFGVSFGLLELGQKNDFIHLMEQLGYLSIVRTTFPQLAYWARTIPLPLFNQAVGVTRRISQCVSGLLGDPRCQVSSGSDALRQTIFTPLFQAKSEGKVTPEEVRNAGEVLLLGGSDTTAMTLIYFIWAVCTRPNVQAALVKELQTLPDNFSDSDLKALHYLNNVIQETERLYTAAPAGLPRVVPAGGTELCGYRLDAGTTVCMQAFTLHRNPDVYPQPEEFDPSRWNEPTRGMIDSFIVFGKGGRNCIGIHFAQIELRLAAAKFFLTFPDAMVSALDGMNDDDMAPDIHFLLTPKGKRCLIEISKNH